MMKREILFFLLIGLFFLANINLIFAYTFQGNIYSADGEKFFPQRDLKIEIELSDNKIYKTYSNDKGYFFFDLNDSSQNIISLSVFLGDCLVF